jgi:hypothetical protein
MAANGRKGKEVSIGEYVGSLTYSQVAWIPASRIQAYVHIYASSLDAITKQNGVYRSNAWWYPCSCCLPIEWNINFIGKKEKKKRSYG